MSGKRKEKSFWVVRSRAGLLRLSWPSLFAGEAEQKQKGIQSLHHTLAMLSGIETIKLSPRTQTVRLCYQPHRVSEKKILKTLSKKPLNDDLPSSRSSSQKEEGKAVLSPLLFSENGHKPKSATFAKIGERFVAWKIAQNLPGRLRAKHDLLGQNVEACQYIEKALMGLAEVKNYKVSHLTTSVLISYDAGIIQPEELLKTLDEALGEALAAGKKAKRETRLALTTTSLGFAAISTIWAPWLLPISFGFVAWSSFPIVKNALHAMFVKKKIKVDILDATIITMCLTMNQVATAAFMVWVLDIAGDLMSMTSQQSRKLLAQIFGKHASYAYLLKEEVEIKVPVSQLQRGDLIMVRAGEQIPIDGIVMDGEAMVDQHALTGESAPVEKRKGEKALAATTVLAGSLSICVLEAGENTNANKIIKIIEEAATSPVKLQGFAEKMADRMVVPTLALAAAGMTVAGSGASLAIINCDFGTGIRVASPMAVLATIASAARHGVLIKNGAVLEVLPDLSTVVFDKTGTLTQETPEVAAVIGANGHFDEKTILTYAAAAEQRFGHPIAAAILQKAQAMGLTLPKMDDSKYHVGFGIQVGINGDTIKVGSPRFMEKEGIPLNAKIQGEMERISAGGRSSVLVAVNDHLAGMVELQSSQRPEALGLIQALKNKGIKTVLISGDQEAATRDMAEKLEMDDYVSQVLPQDKARFVKQFQRGGRKVAMVGDGINDAVALSKADVSVSLKGATDMATDVASVIFMDGNLLKFHDLMEFSNQLRKNVRRSFGLICISNTIGIVGAFFGVVGLSTTLLLNNGVNMFATMNGMLPLFSAMDENEKTGDAHVH